MAETPVGRLVFTPDGCPDCAQRVADLPVPPPAIPEDIDMRARDFDGLRRVMLEDLAARRPDRTRWTAADLDVTLVEAVAVALDELSDLADRVATESYVETARRPATVRWLLELIGADPVEDARVAGLLPIAEGAWEAAPDRDRARAVAAGMLDRHWLQHPEQMAAARRDAVRHLRDQARMVTVADHAERMEDHPLVARAHAWAGWSGSWQTVHVAVIAVVDVRLDELPGAPDERLREQVSTAVAERVERFHADHGLQPPPWELPATGPRDPQDVVSLRAMLQPLADRLRMVGTEVVLHDAVEIPVTLAVSVAVDPDYHRSEVQAELEAVLGSGPGGMFAPGARGFGHDLFASDVVEVAFSVAGVDDVCLNRFKRRGDRHPDRSAVGVITLDDIEVPVLGEGDSGLRITLHGGKVG